TAAPAPPATAVVAATTTVPTASRLRPVPLSAATGAAGQPFVPTATTVAATGPSAAATTVVLPASSSAASPPPFMALHMPGLITAPASAAAVAAPQPHVQGSPEGGTAALATGIPPSSMY
ncbi:hypothetical protein Vafri_21177, partial [Volvox africanus]